MRIGILGRLRGAFNTTFASFASLLGSAHSQARWGGQKEEGQAGFRKM